MKRLAVLCAIAAALVGAGTARALSPPVPVTPPGAALTQPGGGSDGPDVNGVGPLAGVCGTSEGPDAD